VFSLEKQDRQSGQKDACKMGRRKNKLKCTRVTWSPHHSLVTSILPTFMMQINFKRSLEKCPSSRSQTGPVAHNCNLSYSGGRDWEDCGSRTAQGKKLARSCQPISQAWQLLRVISAFWKTINLPESEVWDLPWANMPDPTWKLTKAKRKNGWSGLPCKYEALSLNLSIIKSINQSINTN
jgi:hypothetical protein